MRSSYGGYDPHPFPNPSPLLRHPSLVIKRNMLGIKQMHRGFSLHAFYVFGAQAREGVLMRGKIE